MPPKCARRPVSSFYGREDDSSRGRFALAARYGETPDPSCANPFRREPERGGISRPAVTCTVGCRHTYIDSAVLSVSEGIFQEAASFLEDRPLDKRTTHLGMIQP